MAPLQAVLSICAGVDVAGKSQGAHRAPNFEIERSRGLNNVPKTF